MSIAGWWIAGWTTYEDTLPTELPLACHIMKLPLDSWSCFTWAVLLTVNNLRLPKLMGKDKQGLFSPNTRRGKIVSWIYVALIQLVWKCARQHEAIDTVLWCGMLIFGMVQYAWVVSLQ